MKVYHPDYSEIIEQYAKFKVSSLTGRYLKEEDLLEVFKKIAYKFKIQNEGNSEEERIISSFRLGSGPRKILIWSQMHGNESTTTKSVLDFFRYIESNPNFTENLLNKCSFCIIPVLNPDGAIKYTRVNSNAVDLNRDAFEQTQAESRILQKIYKEFQPDVCFNMHDQRTIFSAGNTNKPATVSFLSPSYNKDRDINEVRKMSMSLISSANQLLQNFIPGQVGRYDDAFNINCIGDYFQEAGTPTVLFEAGHYHNDYEREETRKYIFIALLNMIINVANSTKLASEEKYFEIPENKKLYYDVILRDVLVDDKVCDIAIQYNETLKDQKIEFLPIIEKIDDLSAYYGHREIDVNKQSLQLGHNQKIKEGCRISIFKLNNNVLVI